mmetsp:Transcript_9806/g.17906  ORF Transcript_9806/g.17906 Transcript_9806/m.17906 type:complete len:382 (-) Transcript_9806:85-1230(-)
MPEPNPDPSPPLLKKNKKKKKKKKRKRAPAESPQTGEKHAKAIVSDGGESSGLASRKPSEHVFETVKNEDPGRKYTVSVAFPGSIVGNAQSKELRTYLVGQVARALTIFEVDEVIVFSEDGKSKSLEGEFQGSNRRSDPCVFAGRVLQYLETPQYLRKELFPMHPDLKFAGLLNPLDAPHHLRIDMPSIYREGVVARRPTKPGQGVWVNIGLRQCALVGANIPHGTRVTVQLPEIAGKPNARLPKTLRGTAVAPDTPRKKNGVYWGYSVRLASGLGDVFKGCPYPEGYDLTIGTSERGGDVGGEGFVLPKFKHLLVVFGGLGGLEDAIEGDESLAESEPSELFSMYINSCTRQGSRTIRTEEALPITLSLLRPYILTTNNS